MVVAACGASDAAPTTTDSTVPTVEITQAPPDLEVCRADADAGIAVTELAMSVSAGVEPQLLIGGRWPATLAEAAPELADLLDEVNTRVRECSTPEALAVIVIDRADEITPDSLESTIIWLDTFGPLTTIARNVAPDDTADWVGSESGEPATPPAELDLAAIEQCEMITDGLLTQITAFHALWDSMSPLDLASAPPSLDLGNAVQAARLRAAELGCNVFDLSAAALLAITTEPSATFVGRAQRLTYGEWILATMVGPSVVNTDDVVAEPIGGPEGLAGFSLSNRTDDAQTDVVLIVEGNQVFGPATLAPGESVWAFYPGGPEIPDYEVDWAR